MKFAEIEAVLGRSLPPSAYRHRGFWSNNGDNNVMTKAWLAAGFVSADVDMKGQRLNFVMAAKPVDAPAQAHLGVGERRAFDFRYDDGRAGFDIARGALSPRAQKWLGDDMNKDDSKNKLVIEAIENLVAKSIRLKIVEKYSGLKIGSGSDSVALIREERDGT